MLPIETAFPTSPSSVTRCAGLRADGSAAKPDSVAVARRAPAGRILTDGVRNGP